MWSLGKLFSRRRRRFDDISVSIGEHIEERAEELMEEGMAREQAMQAARREFGNVTLVQEHSREVWQWAALESLLADLKLTLRRLRKSPGFAATVLLTMALGIGANTAVFSVVNSVLLKPLSYPEPQQLVTLRLTAPGLADFRDELRLSPSMYLTLAAHNRSFQSVGVWQSGTASITGIAEPEQVNTALITDGVLQTLNVPPAVGRWLTAADQVPHGTQRVMLSYGYWQRRFGGDPSVVGRTIEYGLAGRERLPASCRAGSRWSTMTSTCWCRWPSIAVKQSLAGFGYRGIARLQAGRLHGCRPIPMWRA